MTAREYEKGLDFIIFGENSWRITTEIDQEHMLNVFYDAHKLTVAEARKDIHNIVNLARFPIKLHIIHGYHNGHAIKDMLTTEDFYGKVISRTSPQNNIGLTTMEVV